MRVRVIGVGTRAGDDAAGLAVAERLAQRALPEDVVVTTCERPLPDLLELFGALAPDEAAIVVDAFRSSGRPGSVRRLDADDVASGAGLSSHACGVGKVLGLADALGRRPRHLDIVGIAAAPGRPVPGATPSPAVAAALDEACRLVIELALRRRAED